MVYRRAPHDTLLEATSGKSQSNVGQTRTGDERNGAMIYETGIEITFEAPPMKVCNMELLQQRWAK